MIFEPTVLLQKTSLIDSLNGLTPELASQALGSPLKLSQYPSLRKLIQTNFFSFPGVYKFRVSHLFNTGHHELHARQIPEG
jgi:hypothetical protein